MVANRFRADQREDRAKRYTCHEVTSKKFLNTRNPTSADFSGWNCTPITFSRSTTAVNAPP
jgi:hypothetical protein